MNKRQYLSQHKKDLKEYKAFAKRIFYRALKKTVLPVIENNSVQVSSGPMARAYMQVYEYIGSQSARKEFERLKKQEPMKAETVIEILLATWREWMRSYVIEHLGKRIKDVTKNTQDKINKSLQESLENGLTRNQTSEAIYRATLGKIGRTRAELIGRTETTTAHNVGKLKSANDWGQLIGAEMYKKWIHVPSKYQRLSHIDEGTKPPIAKDEKFQVYDETEGNVDYMELPGDVTAGPGQICNCNCTVVMMSKRFAERNYNLYG